MVCTIDGENYFYTANNNVLGSGDAITDTYIAYNPANTSAFNANYSTSGAVGYLDYYFELKANASQSGTPEYIKVTELQFTYGGVSTDKVFRVAFFVENLGTSHSVENGGVGTLVTILKKSDAANFTATKAVKDASNLDTVSNADTAATLETVTGGTTNYYRVVAYLWIEGEDTTCNNTTFNTLKGEWGLNMNIKLETATTNAVSALTLSYGDKTVHAGDAVNTSNSVVTDGQHTIRLIHIVHSILQKQLLDQQAAYTSTIVLTSISFPTTYCGSINPLFSNIPFLTSISLISFISSPVRESSWGRILSERLSIRMDSFIVKLSGQRVLPPSRRAPQR